MKLFKITLIALCAFSFLACQTAPSVSPTEVFKAQNEARKKKDVAAMKQNLSKATLELIEKGAKAQNKTLDQVLSEDNPLENAEQNVEIRNEKIESNTASIEVRLSNTEQWVTFPFVKEEGRWKIAYDKFIEEMKKKFEEAQSNQQTNSNK